MDQDRTPTGPKRQQQSNSYLRYGGFAFQLFGGMGLAGWLGYRLDHYFDLRFPAFLLSFVLLVFAGMIYQAYKNFGK
jgi:Putative F0F1-ATPase subunit Ca2+/Mg2+ transporter